MIRPWTDTTLMIRRSREGEPPSYAEWCQDYIETRPDIVGGNSVFKGTRITLDQIAGGLLECSVTYADIKRDLPTLNDLDIAYSLMWLLERRRSAQSSDVSI